jgi:NADP-dependent 3-hydroxy acid dehydrogenase YdfG
MPFPIRCRPRPTSWKRASFVEKAGRRALTRVADVRDLTGLQRAFDAGVGELGRVDIVSANAGVILTGSADPDEAATFRLGVDILLTGVWNTMQVAIPHLLERDPA